SDIPSSCAESLMRCESCGDGDSNQTLATRLSCDTSSLDSSNDIDDLSPEDDLKRTSELEDARKTYNNCAPLASSDVDQLRKDADSSKKNTRDQTKAVREAKKDMDDAVLSEKEQLNKLKTKSEELQLKAVDKAQKITKDLRDANSEVDRQVS